MSDESDAVLTPIQTDLPVLDVTNLFKNGSDIVLRFGDSFYRLKCTRAGKLLLNK